LLPWQDYIWEGFSLASENWGDKQLGWIKAKSETAYKIIASLNALGWNGPLEVI